jgi:type VI secretion system protein VasJ
MRDTSKPITGWHWAAVGKHPAVRDFMEAGVAFPLFEALSQWMEKGYEERSRRNEMTSLHSWRFWARGGRKNSVACGLLKDSCDDIGRPYPLLIMGTGELDGWEEHWDLLPLACETTWGQMESFSTRMYKTFQGLEQDLYGMRIPAPRWEDFSTTDFSTYTSSPSRGLIENFVPGDIFSVQLEPLPAQDQKMHILAWHRLCRNHVKELPVIVFMGNAGGESSHLFMARRALAVDDFERLWAENPTENERSN